MMRFAAVAVYSLTAVLVGAVAWYAVAGSPQVRVLAPAPIGVLLPALALQEYISSNLSADIELGLLLPIVPIAAFLVVAFPISRGVANIPMPTLALFGMLATFSLVYSAVRWPAGVEYQGRLYTSTLAAVNLAVVLFTAWVAWRGRRRASSVVSYVFHTTFLVWLNWFAFPWLGEGM